MSAPSAQRTFRQRDQYIPNYPLDSLFEDSELALKLKIARHRITKTFALAVHPHHGKYRTTDNYIIGIGMKQKDLVKHVNEHVVVGLRSGIVTSTELPAWLGDSPSRLRSIAMQTDKRLIELQVAMMCSELGEIWVDLALGTWNILQSVSDEYRLDLEFARQVKQTDARLRREARHGHNRLAVVH